MLVIFDAFLTHNVFFFFELVASFDVVINNDIVFMYVDYVLLSLPL